MIDLSEVCNSDRRKRYFVGVPLLLLVVPMLPLVVLLAPAVLVGCLVVGVNPLDLGYMSWRLLAALRGTHIEIAQRDRLVLVHISQGAVS